MITKLAEENDKLKEALNELFECFEESRIRVDEGIMASYSDYYTFKQMDEKLKEAKTIMNGLSDKTKDICYRVREEE